MAHTEQAGGLSVGSDDLRPRDELSEEIGVLLQGCFDIRDGNLVEVGPNVGPIEFERATGASSNASRYLLFT